mgnify:CR=1 FL=1
MLYFIIGKIYLGRNGKFEAGYGSFLADPVAKRRTLFLVLFLSVCYPLSKVSGAEDES